MPSKIEEKRLKTLKKDFKIYSVFNGYEIIKHKHTAKLSEIIQELNSFTIDERYLLFGKKVPGQTKKYKGFGNKSAVVIELESLFYNRGWFEKKYEIQHSIEGHVSYLQTHALDLHKEKIACEIEWSNKDPFLYRDLNNLSLLHRYGLIDCGIMIIKDQNWSSEFKRIGISESYGASTTHSGKLLDFIESDASGTCPLLIFNVQPSILTNKNKKLDKNSAKQIFDIVKNKTLPTNEQLAKNHRNKEVKIYLDQGKMLKVELEQIKKDILNAKKITRKELTAKLEAYAKLSKRNDKILSKIDFLRRKK